MIIIYTLFVYTFSRYCLSSLFVYGWYHLDSLFHSLRTIWSCQLLERRVSEYLEGSRELGREKERERCERRGREEGLEDRVGVGGQTEVYIDYDIFLYLQFQTVLPGGPGEADSLLLLTLWLAKLVA